MTNSQGIILVVDDNVDIKNMLHIYFEGIGYKVILAQNGAEAIEKAHAYFPHVILLEFNLPDISGYAVQNKLKQTQALREIPIIFMGPPKPEDRYRIVDLALGRDDYITKPFDIEEVNLRIEAAIQYARRMRRKFFD